MPGRLSFLPQRMGEKRRKRSRRPVSPDPTRSICPQGVMKGVSDPMEFTRPTKNPPARRVHVPPTAMFRTAGVISQIGGSGETPFPERRLTPSTSAGNLGRYVVAQRERINVNAPAAIKTEARPKLKVGDTGLQMTPTTLLRDAVDRSESAIADCQRILAYHLRRDGRFQGFLHSRERPATKKIATSTSVSST